MIPGFETRHGLVGSARYWGSSSAPDTSGQNAAALMQAELSKEQLDWAKQIYAESTPERNEANARANEISDAQLAATKQQTQIAADAYNDYKSTYQPLEQSLVAEAQGYDTPERRAAEAAKASADVQAQVDAQRGATMREQERSGVNPASGKIMALQGAMDLGAAKLKAGAANMAVRQVETVGAAKKADAANLGRGIASSQATNASLAMQQGNSSVANSGAALAATNSGTATMQQGFSGAQAGLAGASNTYGSIAAAQGATSSANSANLTAGIGAAATTAAIFF